jgi:hypothetical protein
MSGPGDAHVSAPRRFEAADRANQDVPPWPGDETVEEHPAAWATIEGAHLGVPARSRAGTPREL